VAGRAVLGDPARLASLKANARRIATPRAAFEVADRAVAMA
jgi:UDP-N-acetylglucosamine:LPS N-acetylglucosamine transferase